MRILLYTGKGGVGKTSVAAATALRCAELGYRTIVISTDSAHSLADSFDLPLGPEPTPIAGNLWGQELDALHQMERHWGSIQRYVASVFAWQGLEGIVAEEMTVFPGLEELASLIQVVQLYDAGEYEVIIMDCAPTGATLQLLTMPEIGRWYLEKVLPLEKKLMALGKPLIRALTDAPFPEKEIYDTLESLIRQLDRMQRLLTDGQRSSARLVLNPEKMVVKESQRAYTYLSLYGYPTDAVICNRILPPQADSAYLAEWHAIQAHYRQVIEDSFAPLPILEAPFFEREVVGMDMLRHMGRILFADRDPAAVLYSGDGRQIVRTEQGYSMQVPLPFPQGKINLTRSSSDELVVHIANRKRILSLPHTLAAMKIQRARHEQGTLYVDFGRD
jgi:arsenite-transporting ATPase